MHKDDRPLRIALACEKDEFRTALERQLIDKMPEGTTLRYIEAEEDVEPSFNLTPTPDDVIFISRDFAGENLRQIDRIRRVNPRAALILVASSAAKGDLARLYQIFQRRSFGWLRKDKPDAPERALKAIEAIRGEPARCWIDFSALIADDESFDRSRIESALKEHFPALIHVYNEDNVVDAEHRFHREHPEVAFLDIEFRRASSVNQETEDFDSGLELAEKIWTQYPHAAIIIVSRKRYQAYVLRFTKVIESLKKSDGVSRLWGWVQKDRSPVELASAARQVLQGTSYMDPEIYEKWHGADPEAYELPPDQYEVLMYAALGYTDVAIARLCRKDIGHRAVEARLKQAYAKLEGHPILNLTYQHQEYLEHSELPPQYDLNDRSRGVWLACKAGIFPFADLIRLDNELIDLHRRQREAVEYLSDWARLRNENKIDAANDALNRARMTIGEENVRDNLWPAKVITYLQNPTAEAKDSLRESVGLIGRRGGPGVKRETEGEAQNVADKLAATIAQYFIGWQAYFEGNRKEAWERWDWIGTNGLPECQQYELTLLLQWQRIVDHIVANVNMRQSGFAEKADKVLQQAEKEIDGADVWVARLIKYAAGKMTKEELLEPLKIQNLEKAQQQSAERYRDRDKATLAQYLIANDFLSRKESKQAREHFQWIIDHGNLNWPRFTAKGTESGISTESELVMDAMRQVKELAASSKVAEKGRR